MARLYNAGRSIPEIRDIVRPGFGTECIHEKIRGSLRRNRDIPGVICLTHKRNDLLQAATAYATGRPRDGSITQGKRRRCIGEDDDDFSARRDQARPFGPRRDTVDRSWGGSAAPLRPSSSSSALASASSSFSSSSASSSYNNTGDGPDNGGQHRYFPREDRTVGGTLGGGPAPPRSSSSSSSSSSYNNTGDGPDNGGQHRYFPREDRTVGGTLGGGPAPPRSSSSLSSSSSSRYAFPLPLPVNPHAFNPLPEDLLVRVRVLGLGLGVC